MAAEVMLDAVAEGGLIVNAYAHPLRHSPVQAIAPLGLSVAQIVGDAHERVHVVIDGEYLPREQWPTVCPALGQVIEVRAVPAGGNDDFWRVVGTVLIAAAAFYVGPWVAAQYGAFAGAAASAAISLGGTLALNALLPPPTPSSDNAGANSLQGITGTRNGMAPYGLIPRPFGRIKVYPLALAKPMTNLLGNDQQLRMLFGIGVGSFQLSQLKIGDSLISQFQDVQLITNAAAVDGSYGGAVSLGDPLQLYTRDVDEASYSDVVCDKNGPTTIIRTTAPLCNEVGIDFTMPSGLIIRDDDTRYALGIMLRIEHSPTGTGLWENLESGSGIGKVTLSSENIRSFNVGASTGDNGARFFVTGITHDTLRAGLTFKFPYTSQFDIRIRAAGPYRHNKVSQTPDPCGGEGQPVCVHTNHYGIFGHNWSPELSGVTQFNDLTLGNWDDPSALVQTNTVLLSAIRSWQPGAPVAPDVAASAVLASMSIRASQQLNGIVDQFSMIINTVLPVWNGATWSNQPTRNPAWAYVEVLTGIANPRALSVDRLNLPEIKVWADWCDVSGFYYDSRGDADKTVFELIREITAAGRASWAIRDGLYTVVRDTEALTPVQMFTPRNSWGFGAIKAFPDHPHALKVRYANPAADYAEDEALVYSDGYSVDGAGGTIVASQFEEMPLPGVTDYEQAWKLGRYHLAQLKLRPEVYKLNVDIENLVCSRGSLVRCAHDVTLWGSGWGRIKSTVGSPVTSFVSDEIMTMDGVSTYVVRVRRSDGTQVVQQVTTVVGNTTTLTPTVAVTGIAAGDLFIMGIQGQESVDLKVTRIDPGADLTATLTLVDAAPNIHLADQGAIPPYQTHITQPLDLARITPPVPQIINIRSNESVLVPGADGTLRVRVVVYYGFAVQAGLPGLLVEMRLRRNNGHDQWQSVADRSADLGQIDSLDPEELAFYEIQLRAVNGALVSAWSTVVTHQIIGKSTPPSNATNFVAMQNGNVAIMSWDVPPDEDWGGSEIRRQTLGVLDWNTATFVTATRRVNNVTTANIPPGQWTMLIKHYDVYKTPNYSIGVTYDNIEMVNSNDIIDTVLHVPGVTGMLVGFVRHWTGKLVPQDQNSASTYGFELFDSTVPTPVAISTFTSPDTDIGIDNTVRIWSSVESALGIGVASANDPVVLLDSRLAAGIYDGFEAWNIGARQGRYFKWQLSQDNTLGARIITGFNSTLDLVERTEQWDSLTIAVGGTVVVFATPFHRLPYITGEVYDTTKEVRIDAVTKVGNVYTQCTVYIYNRSTNASVGGVAGKIKVIGV